MRASILIIFGLLAGCARQAATAPKAAAEMSVNAELDGARLRFTASAAWRLDPKLQSKESLILEAVDRPETAVSVMLEEAELGSTAAQIAGKWQALALLGKLCDFREARPVMARSDEDASFTSLCASKGGDALTLFGAVHIVSGHGRDFWAIALAISPNPHAFYASVEAYRIVRSMKIKTLVK